MLRAEVHDGQGWSRPVALPRRITLHRDTGAAWLDPPVLLAPGCSLRIYHGDELVVIFAERHGVAIYVPELLSTWKPINLTDGWEAVKPPPAMSERAASFRFQFRDRPAQVTGLANA